MPKYFKNKNTRYSKKYELLGADLISAETENMYIDYSSGAKWLESFPGYRRVKAFSGKIHGIYRMGKSEDDFLVHSGKTLYRCRFGDSHKDELQSSIICDLEDKKSLHYRAGDNVCFVFDKYINIINNKLSLIQTGEASTEIYIPTTYVNGVEEEQFNLLSNRFKEESLNVHEADFAYESKGLLYRIISESERTCAVIGAEDLNSVVVEIPNRKMINGRYYKVVEIADGAFRENNLIRQVIIGCGVKRVGRSAFKDCYALQVAVMPDGVETIDDSAFAGCSGTKEIYIGTTCKNIFYNAFDGCNESTNFYLSGTYDDYEKCDGIGNIMIYPVFYTTKFEGNSFGIPIYSPLKHVNSVTVDGVETARFDELDRGIVKIPKSAVGTLEGKDIIITGTLNTDVLPGLERGTPLEYFLENTTAREEILSCAGSEYFDGRAFLFAPKSFPNMILASSFTREGKVHPLYFGSLDYFTIGSPLFPITDVKKEGGRLAIAKAGEDGGSIFLCQPKGEEGAMYGRKYPIIYTLKNTGIRSPLYEFQSSTIFLGRGGVCRMKYSSSSAIFEPISEGCPTLMQKDIEGDVVFSSYEGYLAVFSKYNLYLGDSRFTFPSPGINMRQFKWFPIKNIGSHVGEYRQYFYAQTAVAGTYIHPDVGKATTETVYSYVDEDGDTIYYVQIGPRKYRVLPGEELMGGELIGASAAINFGDTVFFGTECGDVFAFNTDKKGHAPKHLYTRKDHNSIYFKKAFAGKIHPYFYSHGEHRVRYSVTTAPYDGEVPYVRKSDIKDSLTARLRRMCGRRINFCTKNNSGEVQNLSGIPLGELDFYEMDFGEISFSTEDVEIVSVPQRQEKWAEKQITIYTEENKSPFAVNLISHGFKIDGSIKNM